jgi:hypothetical protein
MPKKICKQSSLASSASGLSQSVRRKWNSQELDALQIAFARFKDSNTLPGWADIIAAQRQFPILKKRSREVIKARFVHLKKTRH